MPMGGGISKNENPYTFYGDPYPGVTSAGFSGYGVPMVDPRTVTPAGKPATAGTVGAAQPVTYNPAVGGIPAVADPLAAILKAIQASTTNLPAIQNLSSQIAAYNQAAGIKAAQSASQAAMQNAITNLPAYENYAQQIAAYNQKIGAQQAAAAQASALANNLQNLPATESLAGQINAFNQAQAVKQISDLYPQFGANTAQLGADVADWAAGRLSDSTVNALTRAAMERGVAGGFGPDSASTNAALMALIGKTSEALQQQGLTGQNTLLSGIPRAPLADMTSFMLSPSAVLGQMGSSALPVADFNVSPNAILQTMGSPSLLTNYMVSPDAIYNAQQQANLYAAAPNPADAYNLAMGNAGRGLGAGFNAARGPYAGVPTTGGTSSPEILKMLQDLMQRPFATTPATQTATAPASTINYSDYAMPGMDVGGEFDAVPAGANYDPYAPISDEDWYNMGGI